MKELIENLQKWFKRNKTDDSSTDTGDSSKREWHWYTRGKGTPAANLKLHLAFTVKVITGGKPVKFSTHKKKDEISIMKRNCVTTTGVRIMKRITAEVALASSASRDTT